MSLFPGPNLKSLTRPTTGPLPNASVFVNNDRAERPDIMGAPGDSYDAYKYSWANSVVRRRPLVYSPASTTRHNYGLLPRLRDMVGMSLAFRHQGFREEDIEGMTAQRVGMLFVLAAFLPIPTLLLGRHLPWSYVPIVAGVLSFAWMLVTFVRREASLMVCIYVLLLPILALTAVKLFALMFTMRIVGVCVASVVSWCYLRRLWRRPLELYMEWLYTHPRLRPSTRANRPALVAKPDWMLLGLVLAVLVVGPMLSTTLTLCVLALLAAHFSGWSWRRLRAYSTFGTHVLAPYVTYGGVDAQAPGVWRPAESYVARRRAMTRLFIPLMIALAVGTNLFLPAADFSGKHGLTVPTTLAAGSQRIVAALTEQTDGAFLVLARGLTESNAWGGLGWFAIAMALSVVLPPGLFAAIFRAPLAELMDHRASVEGGTGFAGDVRPGLDADDRTEWQWYVDRVRESSHRAPGALGGEVTEAEHLFMGVEPHAAFPVLLDRKLLAEHCYMVGDSGSGKTSLGLMPLLIQLIRGYRLPDGSNSPCPPIVILDLKGDMALFQLARKLAAERGAAFRAFSPEKKRDSHYFNPFASLDSKYRSQMQLCNVLMESLSLNHGEGYGRGYYSRQTRSLLRAAISRGQPPESLKELLERLREVREQDSDLYRDTIELLSTIETLADYKKLGVTTSPARSGDAIHMPTVLHERQVVYFYLPAAVESVSVREIAKLAVYCLLTACIDRQRSHPNEGRQAYLFIDEFQRIAGENFRLILEQARSFGLSLILANQSVSDLKTPDVDLRPTVRTNTRIKRFFSLTDPADVQAMVESSGEELAFLRSWNEHADIVQHEMVSAAYESRSDTQSLKPRLTKNDVMAISDHPLDSILLVSRGSGYTQFAGLPIHVRCTWPLSRKENTDLLATPWPDGKLSGESFADNDRSPLDLDSEREARAAREHFGKLQSLIAQHA